MIDPLSLRATWSDPAATRTKRVCLKAGTVLGALLVERKKEDDKEKPALVRILVLLLSVCVVVYALPFLLNVKNIDGFTFWGSSEPK